jgi:O-methyltransferase
MTNGVTVVSPESIWVMVGFLRHCLNIEGDFVEMGVYKGGTTAIINRILSEQNSAKHFFAYDTFEGMPETDSLKDFHREKDFADVNLASVKEYISRYSPVSRLSLVPGILPKSALETLPQRIAFVHIDLDIFEAISKSLALVYPRVSSGGVILFDDYGAPTCYGARLAVDKFFENKKEFPIVLGTSQAFIIKK